jgi:SAM-dependent methyltransferase
VEPFAAKAVRGAYDAVAQDYADAFAGDLERTPLDQAILDTAVDRLAGRGPVVDVGCGPGQVGDYLAVRGLQVVGVDLAPGMLSVARGRTANVALACANMLSLPLRSGSCCGAVAFYSLQHLPRATVGDLFGEFRRILTWDGVVILATHLGEGEVSVSDFLGHTVEPFGGTFYPATHAGARRSANVGANPGQTPSWRTKEREQARVGCAKHPKALKASPGRSPERDAARSPANTTGERTASMPGPAQVPQTPQNVRG